MVDWLAGKRVRGTSSERTPLGTGIGGTGVGGWVELGRSTSSTPSVSSLADKRYYMVLSYKNPTSATQNHGLRFNSDIDPNYSWRYSANDGTETTATSISYALLHNDAVSAIDGFDVTYIANRSANEKLMINHSNYNDAIGASNVTNRNETVSKWANISDSIDEIGYRATGGDWGAGGEIVVLGWDPADTHTNNFWEELHSDSQTGQTVDNINSGTFTNKKYLWVQCWFKGTTNTTVKMTFNNSSDSTYAWRYSNNGGADSTGTSQASVTLHNAKANATKFLNMFIVNDGSNEILGIAHMVEDGGSGAVVDPDRRETVFKRSTATAITDIEFDNDDTGDFTDWEFKIWGAD